MTWELLGLFVVLGVVAGVVVAYLKRRKTPYEKSLSQTVRETGRDPGDAGRK